MSVFTPSGSAGAPSAPVVISGSTVPTTVRVLIALANTEQSYTFPASTKQFRITVFNGTLKVADTSGQSGTTYYTVPWYGYVADSFLSAVSNTIYFQSPTAGHTIEIRSWA